MEKWEKSIHFTKEFPQTYFSMWFYCFGKCHALKIFKLYRKIREGKKPDIPLFKMNYYWDTANPLFRDEFMAVNVYVEKKKERKSIT